MKVKIESTHMIVDFNGVPARVWEGKTEKGIKIVCYVTKLAISESEDNIEGFEIELNQHKVPSPEVSAIPLRMQL